MWHHKTNTIIIYFVLRAYAKCIHMATLSHTIGEIYNYQVFTLNIKRYNVIWTVNDLTSVI